MTKVHVTLVKQTSGGKLQEVADRVVRLTQMKNINQTRLERYSILSGDVPEKVLPLIQHLDGIEAVNYDEVREAAKCECGATLKNNLYGNRCEDCYAGGQQSLPMSYPIPETTKVKKVTHGRRSDTKRAKRASRR